ncbi:MAG: type II toxin-antitoxin system HicA family toxin [Fimbriimonadaceae bacterium]|nr:type II toxin-antitoxin system HicA family toxin [Fimbriimonadaceae bacterium]
MKVSDVIKKVEADGWRLVRTSGSHRHFTHPEKPGIDAEMPKGTLSNVLKQAGLK